MKAGQQAAQWVLLGRWQGVILVVVVLIEVLQVVQVQRGEGQAEKTGAEHQEPQQEGLMNGKVVLGLKGMV